MADLIAAEHGLASWALTYLAHSSLLLCGAWLVHRMGVLRGPRSLESLWGAAMLGGIVTATLVTLAPLEASPNPPTGRTEIRVTAMAWTADTPLPTADGAGAVPASGDGPHVAPALAMHAVTPARAAVTEACRAAMAAPNLSDAERLRALTGACSVPSGLPWDRLLLLLWGLGVLILGGREVSRHRALRRIRRGLEPADARARASLRPLTRGTATTAVRVVTSHDVHAPCVVGPGIIALPPRCQTELDTAELVAVLAHELAHVERGDPFRQAAFRWLAVALWFQPLNRNALRQLGDLAELVCDDWAVARIRRPEDLARSISRVAEWCVSGAEAHPVLVTSQGGRISSRVRRILGGAGTGGHSRGLAGAAVGVLLLASVCVVPPLSLPSRPQSVFVVRGDEVTISVRGVGIAPGDGADGPPSARWEEVRVLRLAPEEGTPGGAR